MTEEKNTHKHEHLKTSVKTDEKKETIKHIEVKHEKKADLKPKKTEAVFNGRNLSVSLKHAVAICNMIRGKDIDVAVKMLEEVVKYKRAVPMRGEIPHRKGMMSGRYPINGCEAVIPMLKSLKSNAIANEMDLEKYTLFCMPNVAPRPYKRFGQGRFKRCHITLKLIPIKIKKIKKKVK